VVEQILSVLGAAVQDPTFAEWDGKQNKQNRLIFCENIDSIEHRNLPFVRPCACSSPEHVNLAGSKCHAQWLCPGENCSESLFFSMQKLVF
jgi:hypothetical protein